MYKMCELRVKEELLFWFKANARFASTSPIAYKNNSAESLSRLDLSDFTVYSS